MSFKDLIVIFTDARGAADRLALAAKLAAPQEAHLIGLHLMPPITLLAGGIPYTGTEREIRALEAIEADRRAGAQKIGEEIAEHLRSAAENAGLTHEFRSVEHGDIEACAALHARHADIAILGQNDPEHPSPAPDLAETVLLGAGRPVLVIPYAGRFSTVGHSVLVAWNATREAARAVNDAMPIIAKADKVTVLSVNPPSADFGGPAWPGADISLHLARHGAVAEASSTVSHDIDVGNAILSRAADFGADLIVMGGYGHSRQREFILGGVTRTLLQHMTVPVLLSH